MPRLFLNSREQKNAQSRNRTSDTRIFSPLLYQLSYLGICDMMMRLFITDFIIAYRLFECKQNF